MGPARLGGSRAVALAPELGGLGGAPLAALGHPAASWSRAAAFPARPEWCHGPVRRWEPLSRLHDSGGLSRAVAPLGGLGGARSLPAH
eukprot:scaffold46625_cov18-Phaeocystis_antarctica.AAC.1